jgi:hypothetical protein
MPKWINFSQNQLNSNSIFFWISNVNNTANRQNLHNSCISKFNLISNLLCFHLFTELTQICIHNYISETKKITKLFQIECKLNLNFPKGKNCIICNNLNLNFVWKKVNFQYAKNKWKICKYSIGKLRLWIQ